MPSSGTIVLIAVLTARAACAQEDPITAVGCSPDKPLIATDGTVLLRAWVRTQPAETPRFAWTASDGVVTGNNGREARWDLRGLPSGIYTAGVTVESTSLGSVSCSVRVVVAEADRGTTAVRQTVRTYLSGSETESAGYGLYSYLLFGSHPTESSRERYRKVVAAYLATIDTVAGYSRQMRGKLNVTYLPLIAKGADNADTDWILQNYDFPRARILLDTLPGNRRTGIYLVSSLSPLPAARPPYLVQDLTTVPAGQSDLISWWIEEFMNQAAQEKFWEPRTGEFFALRMRTTISVLAEGLPQIQHAVDGWISWVK